MRGKYSQQTLIQASWFNTTMARAIWDTLSRDIITRALHLMTLAFSKYSTGVRMAAATSLCLKSMGNANARSVNVPNLLRSSPGTNAWPAALGNMETRLEKRERVKNARSGIRILPTVGRLALRVRLANTKTRQARRCVRRVHPVNIKI